MNCRIRIAGWPMVLALLVLGAACVPVPQLTPNYEGLGDLPLRTFEPDKPPYPSVLELPRLAEPGQQDATPVRPAYRVGPNDQLVVTVWGRKDLGSQIAVALDGEVRASLVREDGTLIIPFLDPLPVGGKTLEEVRQLIQSKYAALIEKPQIEVRMFRCASRLIEVGGEVAKPGQYSLCDDRLTLGEVISAAGAPLPTADRARAVLTRRGRAYLVDFRESQRGGGRSADVLLEHGDALFFPKLEERAVYVFGEVRRQGTYPIPEHGLTLLDALGRAEGPNVATYQTGGIFLIRSQKPEGLVVYKLKMSEILEAPEIQLADGDRVFVALSGLSRWDLFWRKVLPFSTTFRSGAYYF